MAAIPARRLVIPFVVALTALLVGSGAASADPEKNPNAITFTATCEGQPGTYTLVLTSDTTAHILSGPEGQRLQIVKLLFVGTEQVIDRRGEGTEDRLVRCEATSLPGQPLTVAYVLFPGGP